MWMIIPHIKLKKLLNHMITPPEQLKYFFRKCEMKGEYDVTDGILEKYTYFFNCDN